MPSVRVKDVEDNVVEATVDDITVTQAEPVELTDSQIKRLQDIGVKLESVSKQKERNS